MKAVGWPLYACHELTCPVVTFIGTSRRTDVCPACGAACPVLVTEQDRQRPAPRDPSGLSR